MQQTEQSPFPGVEVSISGRLTVVSGVTGGGGVLIGESSSQVGHSATQTLQKDRR